MKPGRPSSFLLGVRALFRIARNLGRIAAAQERLADRAEGIAPRPRALPEPPEEPVEISFTPDLDYVRAEMVEQRLRQQLGRQPSAEEICQEIDGIEWDPASPRVAIGRRAKPESLH